MTAAQIRMARAALGLTIIEAAGRAGVPAGEIEALEQGGGNPDIAAKLHGFFASCGVALVDHNGVTFDDSAAGTAKTVPLGDLSSANDE